MISSQTIERVKKEVDLVSIVSELVQLKSRGGNFIGLCPFHSEKSPSFNVKASENFYHCFGCGASGNAISFVMQQRGLSYPETIEYLANKFNIPIEYTETRVVQKKEDKNLLFEINNKACEFFQLKLIEELNNKTQIYDYILSRGLSKQALQDFKVGFCPNEWTACFDYLRKNGYSEKDILSSGLAKRGSKDKIYDTFKSRLIFPVFFDINRIAGFGGRIIPAFNIEAAKYLNSSETPVYEKSKILYGFPQAAEQAKSQRIVYIVEGYLDVISLTQQGVKNVVAVCGTSLTKEHLKRIATISSRVRLLLDSDDAGQKAAAKTFSTFVNSGLDAEVLFITDGKDPDDVAKKFGSGTKNYLEGLERKSLLEVFIHDLVVRSGHKTIAEIGTATKGKIANNVLEVISFVSNSVEKSELIKQASFILSSDLVAPKVVKENPKLTDKRKISNFEKEVLILACCAKNLIKDILLDGSICSFLSDGVIELISILENNGELPEQYLKIGLESQKISKLKGWNPEKVLSQIKQRAEFLSKQRALSALNNAESEEDKLKYYQERLKLHKNK